MQSQRQVKFLTQTNRMLETAGRHQHVALFLHEATSLLLARNAGAQSLSTTSATKRPQWRKELEANLVLERIAAEQLGVQDLGIRKGMFLPW